jgi:hypothetical protein
MKLMKILDDESVVPTEALYLDGYSFGDRMLEGLSVKFTIVDGNLVATANWPEWLDANYWKEQAVQYALDADTFSSTADNSGDDGFILFETGQD